jgi:signal recognition particle receptor subunit beta
MASKNILILSGHDGFTDKLISLLKTGDFDLKISDNLADAAVKIASFPVSLFLISYSSILKAERSNLISLFKDARKTKFVLYKVPADASRRLAFYRMGAYRVLDDQYESTDIMHFCRNVLAEVQADEEVKETSFSGSLQDFNLAGLINIFGKEKRSGVLRIQTPVGSGKIYFNNGHIYHAVSGYRKGEDAIFYMSTWNKGWFSMRTLPMKTIRNRIQLSNICLLLHAEQVRSEFFARLQELGGFNKQIRVIHQGDLFQIEKDPVFKDFIEKMNEFRSTYAVIGFSPYKMLDTLEQLIQLKNSNNLEFREVAGEIGDLYVDEAYEGTGLAERLLSSKEVTELRTKLNAQELFSGKLLILGTKSCGKTDFIRLFNQGSRSGVRTNQDLDFTKVELDKDFYLQVFGISMDKKLTGIIKKLSEGLLGYIFLIDAEQPDVLEYSNYLMNYLVKTYSVPWACAVTNLNKKNTNQLRKIRTSLTIPPQRNMLVCDVTNKDDVRNVIMSLQGSGEE